MDFQKDVREILPERVTSFELVGANLPTAEQVFFRSKQAELVEQYEGARIFLRETEGRDWRHWFTATDSEKANRAFEQTFRAYFYEAALMYYNIIVDLSWMLCYCCVEYAVYQERKPLALQGIKTLEEAGHLLRMAEGNVSAPTAQNNPFLYLKKMNPQYEDAINIIIDFWNQFANSPVRNKYNFIKHKGKPRYTEVKRSQVGKVMSIRVGSEKDGYTEIVSDTDDVQWEFSLDDSIEELLAFDIETLHPYLTRLNAELERVVRPSPFLW